MQKLSFYLRLHVTKIFWRIVMPPRMLYWRLFRPKTRGVKTVISYGREVLLVRLNYAHKQWAFPGGGVGRGEDWKTAALREAKEETGITLTDAVEIGEYVNTVVYKIDTVHIFHSKLSVKINPTADGMEIAEAAWFPIDQLPHNRIPRVDMIIQLAAF